MITVEAQWRRHGAAFDDISEFISSTTVAETSVEHSAEVLGVLTRFSAVVRCGDVSLPDRLRSGVLRSPKPLNSVVAKL